MVQIADRSRRLDLHLPARVSGTDVSGAPFEEETRTLDVSGTGIGFECRHHLAMGAHVDVRIELPETLRSHFGGRPVFRTRAVVTRTGRLSGEDLYQVGARFLAGEQDGP